MDDLDRSAEVDYRVDVIDPRYYYDQLTVELECGHFQLIFNEKLKQGKHFDYCIALDEACLSARRAMRYPRFRRIGLLQETPIKQVFQQPGALAQRFDWIYTFDQSLLSQQGPFRKLLLGTSWLDPLPSPTDCEKTQLVSFVGSIQHAAEHGYRLRAQVAQSLLAGNTVHCYGRGIRELENKADALLGYRFSIAMENTRRDWYFTEKLMDCLLSRTVPIYWGCPSISEVFDCRGMLLFNSLEDLQQQLASISEQRYQQMLPFIEKNYQIAVELQLRNYPDLYSRLLSSYFSEAPGAASTANSALPQSKLLIFTRLLAIKSGFPL